MAARNDSSVARAWPTHTCLWGPRPLLLVGKQAAGTRVASSPDSDLEAFSHNPAHASKFRRSKGSLGHAFTVRIRTGNQNQTSFYPSVPHEISVLVELILGHLRYLLTDVPPQPNSPPDNVFRPDRPAEAGLGSKKRGIAPLPIHGIIGFPLVRTSSELAVRRPGEGPRRSRSQSVPPAGTRRPALARGKQLEQLRRQPDGFGTGTPRAQPLRANPFPREKITLPEAPADVSGLPNVAVSAQFGTVTRLPVHPASPVLLTKNGPLGALDSVARLNEAAAPSYLFKNSHPGSSYPEGNFGGNQLLDGSISLSPLYPSQTNDLHVSIAAGLHQSFLWLRPAQA
ncbi:hypothetical protein L1887_46023 [Cichorium endivia]|nr:hypothetical protein L1887_46023 [Cichorium endivia]